MSENNQMMSVQGQLVGMPLAGPESFSQQQLDYLKRALGVDETVLFETNTVNSSLWTNVDLNESISNFERIMVVWVRDGNVKQGQVSVEYYTSDINGVTLIGALDADVSNTEYRYFTECVFNNAKYSESRARYAQYGGTAIGWQTTNSWCHPKRIIGIHRISGGNQ